MEIDLVEYAEDMELPLPDNIEEAILYCREDEIPAEPDVGFYGWTELYLDVLQVKLTDGKWIECRTWKAIEQNFGPQFYKIVGRAIDEKEANINA